MTNELTGLKTKIIDLLRRNGDGLTGKEVANRLSVSTGSASKYLAIMQTEGSVKFRQIGSAKLWCLSEEK